jgi:hypothetical protein
MAIGLFLLAASAPVGLLGRPFGPAGAVPAVLLLVGAFAVLIRGAMDRVPDVTPEQNTRILEAATLYRRRAHTSGCWLPAGLAALVGSVFAAIGISGPPRWTPGVTALIMLGVIGAVTALVAGTVALHRRRLRSQRAAAERAAHPGPDLCRCWERDWFTGPEWHAYRAGHLEPAVTDPTTGVVLLRCPVTGTTWLHDGDSDVTARVRVPEPVEQEELPTGAYL